MEVRNKETRMRREAKSWKSNSREKDEDVDVCAEKKRRREIRNGKFATGMRTAKVKEANARFITQPGKKERDHGIEDRRERRERRGD